MSVSSASQELGPEAPPGPPESISDEYYALVRAVRSAKAYFLASPSLDKVRDDWGGFDKALGHPFELVAVKNPVAPLGPGTPIRVAAPVPVSSAAASQARLKMPASGCAKRDAPWVPRCRLMLRRPLRAARRLRLMASNT